MGAVGRGDKRVQGMGQEESEGSLNKGMAREKNASVPGDTGKEDNTNGGGVRGRRGEDQAKVYKPKKTAATQIHPQEKAVRGDSPVLVPCQGAIL